MQPGPWLLRRIINDDADGQHVDEQVPIYEKANESFHGERPG
jgi:hypothetical protein